ncbi:MAG: ligase-associated DNA damage response endonuclease PdeM [Blastochloris sp.]|nr:ligase-associated DNA damage response endonuclease PdeM [Blastochloris sp.]
MKVSGDLIVELRGEEVRLCPERVMFWPREKTLFVADLHLGKAAALRAGGMPLPGGSTLHDLERLDAVLQRCGAERLIVLGDAFHARASLRAEGTMQEILCWRKRREQVEIILVPGNHDRRAGQLPQELDFIICPGPWRWGPWTLQHEPGGVSEGHILCGHLHPGIRLKGFGRQSLSLPCFYSEPEQTVFPAFGSLTGLARVRPKRLSRIFVVTGEEVIEK